MNPKMWRTLLTIPAPIEIEVGFGFDGCPTARTDSSSLSGVDFEGKISVRLEPHEIQGRGFDELAPKFSDSGVEVWVELIKRMKAFLAQCMFLGA